MYIVIGTEMAFSVIGGLILGQYIDERVGTETPWFTLIGLIAGVAAGFGFLIRMTKIKNGDKSD
jgi:LPXTG-motif cell wall-anchored protein